MDRVRDELLAGAALAGDEHHRVADGDLLDDAAHDRHLLAAADHLGELTFGLATQVLDLRIGLAQPATLGDQLDRAHDLELHDLGLDRLGDEVERAELHRFDRGLDRAEPRDDHDRHVAIDRADLLEHVDAGRAFHLEVRDHEVGGLFLERLDAGLPARGDHRLVAELLDHVREAFAHCLVVVDDEDRGHDLT